MRSKPKSRKKTAKAKASGGSAVRHPAYKSIATDVVEVSDEGGSDGDIVELKDGTLMLAQGGGIFESWHPGPVYRTSRDGGKTWTRSRPLSCDMGVGGMLRLQSGALAIYGRKTRDGADLYFATSRNDGKTWTRPVRIPTYVDFHAMFHSMIQLSSGRLLVTGYWASDKMTCSPPDLQPITHTRWGWWRGVELFVEGHRGPAMGICKVYYSDDEGKSWDECQGGLFGWFNAEGVPDGTGGITAAAEPTLAETKDGRVLLFARCKRGRIAQCYSLDEGRTWHSMQPTELASSQSPPMLVRIPSNGDLLCVWNQVSGAFSPASRMISARSDSGITRLRPTRPGSRPAFCSRRHRR